MSRILSRVPVAFYLILLLCAGPVVAESLRSAEPQDVNIDAVQLGAAVAQLTQNPYRDIDSLLILRNGALVLEYYANPDYYGRDYRHVWRSVSKSVTALLVGQLIEQGRIDGVDVPIRELISEFVEGSVDDPRKNELTLEQVLTMTSGFEWIEVAVPYGHSDNDFNKMARSPDWISYVFGKPLVHQPGTRFEYNGGNSILLSALVQQVTGENVEDFARANLFASLGIENWSWPLAPAGLTNTADGLGMRRIDMARIGQFMLQRGRWGERQILSANMVDEITRERIAGEGIFEGLGYGYQWWRFSDDNPLIRGLAHNDVYFAYGNEGQLLLVVPHLDLVVVSTAALFGDAWARQFEFLRDHIYPAVLQ